MNYTSILKNALALLGLVYSGDGLFTDAKIFEKNNIHMGVVQIPQKDIRAYVNIPEESSIQLYALTVTNNSEKPVKLSLEELLDKGAISGENFEKTSLGYLLMNQAVDMSQVMESLGVIGLGYLVARVARNSYISWFVGSLVALRLGTSWYEKGRKIWALNELVYSMPMEDIIVDSGASLTVLVPFNSSKIQASTLHKVSLGTLGTAYPFKGMNIVDMGNIYSIALT